MNGSALQRESLLEAGWRARRLLGGKVLWRAGDAATHVAWLLSGRLRVRFDGRIRAEIKPGELVGEVSALAGSAEHSGTVQALVASDVLIIATEQLMALGEAGHPTFAAMLRQAESTLMARIEDIRQRVSIELPGALTPLEPEAPAEVLGERVVELRAALLAADDALLVRLGSVGNLDSQNPFTHTRPSAWDDGDPGHDIRIDALPAPLPPAAAADEEAELLEIIRSSVLGGNEAMWTPFGLRKLIYADYTASGRSLRFVEDFIRDQVMPLYANTHTESSATGLQTSAYREEARAIIARNVGADERDAVIFVGSGATGAINKLIDLLDLRQAGTKQADSSLRPVVFVGPYEHHSNILPWHHSLADLVIVPLDPWGDLDAGALETLLVAYADRPLKIGSFSAASNVTGVATDVVAITQQLHAHGALSFWDYAAAGPYVPIDVNAPDGAHIDALFLSPHKFVGGPGTPGLLVLKRNIVARATPTQPGGGTVDFVTSGAPGVVLSYSGELEHREEAGTPAIIESIRCGLVFKVKEMAGAQRIHERESALVRSAVDAWLDNPAIVILGNPRADRLSITSFMIRHGEQYLHYNYVIALLNDLFGLQARGGCSCAGPYGTTLLQLDETRGLTFMQCVDDGWGGLKPGWARVNFNYFISDREFEYIVSAVQLCALYGWALLPQYHFDIRSGLWSHRERVDFEPQRLDAMRVERGQMRWPSKRHTMLESALEGHLEEGRRILEEAMASTPDAIADPGYPEPVESNRWFPLPHEIAGWLRRKES